MDDLDVWTSADDPMPFVHRWVDDAAAAGIRDHTAAVLATVDDDGTPDARYVLVRGIGAAGFVVYTNLDSAKSRQLSARPVAALVLGWVAMQRTIRVRGPVELVDAATADAYFASRPRGSQIAAWASRQSAPIPDRASLEAEYRHAAARFPDGTVVPRPEFWSGWTVVPQIVEFWQGRDDRLHDRVRFTRTGDGWTTSRLQP